MAADVPHAELDGLPDEDVLTGRAPVAVEVEPLVGPEGTAAEVPPVEPGSGDEPGEDLNISCVPDALVLFNPALVLAELPGLELSGFGTRVPEERMGTAPKNLSPAHHVKKGAPPTIIFHGKADTTVPYATVEAFERLMKAAGSRCELVGYEGRTHGFFNHGRGDNADYRDTLARTDAFLVSLGWIAAKK